MYVFPTLTSFGAAVKSNRFQTSPLLIKGPVTGFWHTYLVKPYMGQIVGHNTVESPGVSYCVVATLWIMVMASFS